MHRGEMIEYMIDHLSVVLVVLLVPQKTRYINVVFSRVDAISKSQRMNEYD